jgi:DNA-binding transcriptional regulator YhcF (GntR family)
MPKRLSDEEVNDLKYALTESTSAYDIAKETEVHKSTVSRYFRRLFSNRTINTGDRPTIISKVTKRLIKRKFIERVPKAAKEVYRELGRLGYDISYQSAIKVLKSMRNVKYIIKLLTKHIIIKCNILFIFLFFKRLIVIFIFQTFVIKKFNIFNIFVII